MIQPDVMMLARVLHDTLMRLQADPGVRVDFSEPLEQVRSALHKCEAARQGPPEPPLEAEKGDK